MAKPTKEQQHDLDIRKETLRRHASMNPQGTKRRVSQGITKQASILDRVSQPIRREPDSEFTREDFESDLIKVSKRIKETKPSPKSS